MRDEVWDRVAADEGKPPERPRDEPPPRDDYDGGPPPEHYPDGSPAQAKEAREGCAKKANERGPRRTSWPAPDLLAERFPEPRWAVPMLVAEGLSLLAGPPKLGKSWWALNVAAAVASGGRALGSIPVTLGDALYLALEDPPRRLQERLRIVLGEDPPPAGLTFETWWPTVRDGGADRLGGWLTDHPGCRLVVVDVLARLRGAVAEGNGANRYDLDYAAASALKAVADSAGVPLLVLHHTRKQGSDDYLDMVSGTHGLAGAADTVLVMRRARGSADAVLHVTGRDVEEAEHALTFKPADGAWVLLDGPAAEHEMADTRRRILDLLRGQPGGQGQMSPKAIAQALGLGHETVKKTLQRMAADGQLSAKSGSYSLPPTPLSPMSPSPPQGQRDSGDTPREDPDERPT